eukprot:209415_1
MDHIGSKIIIYDTKMNRTVLPDCWKESFNVYQHHAENPSSICERSESKMDATREQDARTFIIAAKPYLFRNYDKLQKILSPTDFKLFCSWSNNGAINTFKNYKNYGTTH